MVTDEGGNILEEIEFNAYGEITGGGGNMPTTSISEANSSTRSGVSFKRAGADFRKAEANSGEVGGETGTVLGAGGELENLFVGAYGIKYDGKTNLHYMRYRWYSNDQMRFISPDLLLGINRYAYCNNKPVIFVDILALKSETILEQGATLVTVGDIEYVHINSYQDYYNFQAELRIFSREYAKIFDRLTFKSVKSFSFWPFGPRKITPLCWEITCEAYNTLPKEVYSEKYHLEILGAVNKKNSRCDAIPQHFAIAVVSNKTDKIVYILDSIMTLRYADCPRIYPSYKWFETYSPNFRIYRNVPYKVPYQQIVPFEVPLNNDNFSGYQSGADINGNINPISGIYPLK